MSKKKQALLTVLDTKAIYPVFQPIVNLENGNVVAYESLSRIENKNIDINIEELFCLAEAYGCVWKLEKLCRDKALKASMNKPSGTKIFLNVDGQIFQDSNFISGFTNRKLEKFGLSNEDIVFEITERTDIELVRNIHLSKSKQSMMKLLVEYCDEMGLKLIAEGIETQEELECVCNLHVHYGQGYYLGLPDCKFNGVSSQVLQYLMNIHGMIRSK